ncbi:MAG: Hsp33 family molecular chaperone HslO [Oscillospiraceae bacterium]|nr:Hsp33 family molecular chaperone HslO [Oscillospiraceae bacterium]
MDKLIRAISENGEIRLTVVSIRAAVERARQIHRTLPVATAALGRSMAAASMLGSRVKEEAGSLTLRINGGGPIGSIIVVSDPMGNVRGYVQNPAVDIPKRPDGKLAVGAAVGTNGLLTVTKDLGFGDPYVGSTNLVSGEIAEDLAAYYVESEQVGAAVALGVLVDRDQSVLAAGGYIVELLPGASEESLTLLEQNITATGSVTDTLKDQDPEVLVEQVLQGFTPRILQEQPIEYRCYCSRERVIQALKSTGDKALAEMAADPEDTVVTCQFCDQVHRFTPEEIQSLLR